MSKIGYHLERAKMEEMAAKYEGDGYKISREVELGGLRIDMIAERDREKIFFEFLYRPESQRKAGHLTQLRKAAFANGATDFKIFAFDAPKQVEIEVDGLEEALMDALERDEGQSQIDDLGNGAAYEGVYVGHISYLSINESGINIRGFAEVDVEVYIGPSREGMSMSENFPFTYDILLNEDRSLSEINDLVVDTASFFGRDEEEDESDDDENQGPNDDDSDSY